MAMEAAKNTATVAAGIPNLAHIRFGSRVVVFLLRLEGFSNVVTMSSIVLKVFTATSLVSFRSTSSIPLLSLSMSINEPALYSGAIRNGLPIVDNAPVDYWALAIRYKQHM
jgi:hypothetical protein